MAGPPYKQYLEMQADLAPQQKFKSLSGHKPKVIVKILQIIKICDL